MRSAEGWIAQAAVEMGRAGTALEAYAAAPAGAKAGGEGTGEVETHLRQAREDLRQADVELGQAAAEGVPAWYREYLAARREAVAVRVEALDYAEAAFRQVQPLWLALDYLELDDGAVRGLRQDIDDIVGLLQKDQPLAARDRITAARRDLTGQRARYRAAYDASGLDLFRRLATQLDRLDEVLGLLARATEALASSDSEGLRQLLQQVQQTAAALDAPAEPVDQAEVEAWFRRQISERLEKSAQETRRAEELERAARRLVAQPVR